MNSKPFFEKPIKEIDDIEQPLFRFLRSRGWLCEKVISMSRKGWPDRFCARAGRIVLVELKAPGKKPTEQQFARHRELRDQGVEVVWFDNLEQAKVFFQ